MIMKHMIKYLAAAVLVLGVNACQKIADTDENDSQVRIALLPVPSTVDSEAAKLESVVTILEGPSISKKAWTAEIIEDIDWVTIEQTDIESSFVETYSGLVYTHMEKGVSLDISANTEYKRTATLRILVEDGTEALFPFTQLGDKADAEVKILKGKVTFSAEGSTETVTYQTNMGDLYSYEITYEGEQKDWLKITDNGSGSFDLTASEWDNLKESRTATVTVTVGNDKTSLASADLQVEQLRKADFYFLFGPSANDTPVSDAIEMTKVSDDVYTVKAFFMESDGNVVCINRNTRSDAYPVYYLGKDGILLTSDKKVTSSDLNIEANGMRELTVDFSNNTWSWERLNVTKNCLPDEELASYPIKTFTSATTGRSKTFITTCLHWNGGPAIGPVKLGSRMVDQSKQSVAMTGYTDNLSCGSRERNTQLDEQESGGQYIGLVNETEKFGRIYTLPEILTGEPSAGVELKRLFNCWGKYIPGYQNESPVAPLQFEDAAGNTQQFDTTVNTAQISNTSDPTITVQIQGICPYGWHVANVQDMYDLLCCACEAKGVTPNALTSFVGSWPVGDMMREPSAPWAAAISQNAAAAEFGFFFYPQGRRIFKSGYDTYGTRCEMYIVHVGTTASSDKYYPTPDSPADGTLSYTKCYRLNTNAGNSATMAINNSFNGGDAAASFRCVKNYKVK